MKEYRKPQIRVLRADETNIIATSDTQRHWDFGFETEQEYFDLYGYAKY